MEVLERALALEAAGAKVLHLEIGEPDAPPPPAAVEAARAALAEGATRYTDSRGLRALREAIAADKQRRPWHEAAAQDAVELADAGKRAR